MKFLVLLGLCAVVAFVRAQRKNCHCSVVLLADNSIMVAYEDDLLATDHDNCYEDDVCAHKCYDSLHEGTNGGDLNHKPPELGGLSVGDYGCMLFGVDVHDGRGFGYSRLCNNLRVNTNFTFSGSFCCEGGKHVHAHDLCG